MIQAKIINTILNLIKNINKNIYKLRKIIKIY